jgi:hypothetical protein
MRKSCFWDWQSIDFGKREAPSQLHQEKGQLKISMKTKTSKNSRETAKNNYEEENTVSGEMSPLGSSRKHANATE